MWSVSSCCFLGNGHSSTSEYRSEEEGGDWGGVTARTWQEEEGIELFLDSCSYLFYNALYITAVTCASSTLLTHLHVHICPYMSKFLIVVILVGGGGRVGGIRRGHTFLDSRS